jgi:hypothetical protein
MRHVILMLSLFSTILFVRAQNPYVVQPKNEGTLKKEQTLTAEKKFVVDNFPYIHMADWKKGMRFMVQQRYSTDSDNPIIASKLKLKPYKKKGNAKEPLQKDYEFKIFTVEGLEERDVSCPRGRCTRTYVILNCEGEKFEYEYFSGRINEMRNSDVFTTIDKLIYLDEIDKAKQILIGKKFYILENIHYMTSSNHPRFVQITIKDIGIGSSSPSVGIGGVLSGPVKIVYEIESGKENSTEVKLSGTNVYTKGGKWFHEVFSFENPKNNYPEITDEIWDLIQNRKVKIGMTERECELSWGKPENINTTVSDSGRQQQWVYSTTSYLYFDNGKLTSIQN